jgi:nickel-type superoxide dismutase maturation protease
MRRVRGLIGPLVACLALALALARWRLDVVEVRGRSMAPTLLPGDRLLALRLRRVPRPGEIVLAPDPRDPSRELVKRVQAVDATGVTLRGDNPAFSTDARAFGVIPADRVGWRIVARVWPVRHAAPLHRRPRLEVLDEGGEPACAVPDSLVAGEG